ncbi:YkvI family membrane protein [Bowmanella denitrificans]|uniref:YkvI family membrane protein n=1 Tax=Bowmanella denitrificans TaxID=366582 RepID=UPI000C9B6B6B|nr:hypothetical protein [Bowmanella denitrificans]
MINSGRIRNLLQCYFLPGLVFQSVIVGGGYGTGREIAEFFLVHGPVNGLLGMLVASLCWSVVLAIAFEFSRLTHSHDYRRFFKQLLGPGWVLFELIYLLIALLVLAVLGSAAAQMVTDLFAWPGIWGTLILLACIGLLAYLGTRVIERALTFWSVLLYLVYAGFLLWVVHDFGGDIAASFSSEPNTSTIWYWDGVRYAAYNLNALAAVLFVTRHLHSRQQALGAGALAGVIGIVPGIFVFIAMLAQYPHIISAPVPVTALLQGLGAIWFFVVFQLILFGTFVETGAGIIHAINERVAGAFQERHKTLPKTYRLAIALGCLSLAMLLAEQFGLVTLIAKGYGMLSYAYLVVVILPLLTFGLVRILRSSKARSKGQKTQTSRSWV